MRLTVRMMPRRRTKGSQVFTKAPTLREEENWDGKGLMSGRNHRAPCAQMQPGLLPLRKLLEPRLHPQTWSGKGTGPARLGTDYAGPPITALSRGCSGLPADI